MKTEKKLKRGLADLSTLFSPAAAPSGGKAPVQTPPKRGVLIQPPDIQTEGPYLPNLACATFFSAGAVFPMDEQIRLFEALRNPFEAIYFLSLLPGQDQLNEGLDRSRVRFQPFREKIVFGYMPETEFKSVIQPKRAGELVYSSEEKKVLAVLDPAFLEHAGEHALSLLDHCIFVAPADCEQLIAAYQVMQAVVAENPAVRLSLLLSGPGASSGWEFIYERFYEIVSHFLGCDLGFLGWMERGALEVNGELLLDDGGSAAQASAKLRLRELLFQSPEAA